MSNTISFDESFYLSQNPDVAAAVSRGQFTSGAQHYQLNGRFEGRNPNAFFNTSFYLGQYPDVAKAGINPLTHFINFGSAEGRFANATEKGAIDLNNNGGADDFNNAKYLSDYPDVAAAVTAGTFKNGYQHFVQFGQFEARIGTLTNGTTITGPFSNTGVAPNTGSIITLTANADGAGAVSPAANTTGTANNDTYNATDGTLGTADSINGGGGTDTLNVRVTANNVNVAPQLTSVENVTISNVVAGPAAGAGSLPGYVLNLVSATGTTTVGTLDSIAGSVTGFANVAAGTTLRLDNADGRTDFNVAGAASRTGTADAIAIQIANGTGSATTPATLNLVATNVGATDTGAAATADATFETLNVSTSGANSVVNVGLGGANISTLTVTGSAGLTLTETANFANLKTINASGITGTTGINVTTTLAQDVTFTGSAGSDRLAITTAANLTSADKLDFGAGTDTLAFTNVTDSTAANAANASGISTASLNVVNGLTTVEVLEFSNAAVSAVNASDFTTINAFNFSGGRGTPTALAIGTVQTNDTFLFSNGHAGTTTFTGQGVGQTANILLDGGDTLSGTIGAANTAGTGAVAFGGGIQTLSINSTGTTANFITGGAGGVAGGGNAGGAGAEAITNGTAVQSVVITGSQNLTIGGGAGGAAAAGNGNTVGATSTAGFSAAVNVDASNFTGKLSIAGSTGDDTIRVGVASTGDATLTGNLIKTNAGADSVFLNSGVDRLDYRTVADSVSTAGQLDTVNNFTAGTDKFVVGNAVTAVRAVSTTGTGTLDTDIGTALGATNFGGNNNAAYVTITGGSDAGTYLVVDSNGNNGFNTGADLVVKLVGLQGTLSATDFVTTVA